ncbi:MAG TPA: ATP-binding protein [Micromonosporaceae bacterium]|nr:ATP-binding protein [Micromonosporaceae bacterium]
MPGLDTRVLDVQMLRRPDRLAALDHARLLLSAAGAPSTSVARLAGAAVAAPIALVTLLGADGMYVVGSHQAPGAAAAAGVAAAEVPLPASFCQYVVSSDHLVVVGDARREPAMSAPWSGRLLAYLGCPVRGPDGHTVGAVCVVDTVPRRWTDADTAAVGEAARVLESLLAAGSPAQATAAADSSPPDASPSPTPDDAVPTGGSPAGPPTGDTDTLLEAALRPARPDGGVERRFLDALLDSLDTAVAVCDSAGKLVLINQPYGQPTADFDVPLMRALGGEHLRELPMLVSQPDVPPRTFLVNGEPIVGPDGIALGAVVALHDVTERRQAEQLTESEVAASRVLSRAGTVDEAGRLVLDAIGRIQGWRHAELWLAQDVGGGLRPAATWTEEGYDLRDFVPDSVSAGQGLAGVAWESGTPIWSTGQDLPGIPDSAAMAAHHLHLAVAVPVPSAERALGVLTFYADVARVRDEALLALLSGVAAHIGQYVERHRAEELTLELARSKDEFIALVGHELRTPLTSVSAYTELLLTDNTIGPDEQREFLAIIDRNAETLRRIIDDLLDLAGLESGYVTVRTDEVDLATIVREAVAAMRPAAAAKDLEMHSGALPATAPMVGDAARLRQVIDHLLTNAVLYTPGGGTVAVALSDEGAAYRVTVTDNGIGIPQAERQQLFQRFFRASNTRSRGIPGTGLGLTISRTIVERHAGTITVDDRSEPGTTFEVRLPSAR